MNPDLQRFYELRTDYLRAVGRVEEVLALDATGDAGPADVLRDALIPRFEFTFELGWKTMQSFLRWQGEVVPSPRETIRRAPTAGR